MASEVLLMAMEQCPRCGHTHKDVSFSLLANPPQGISHWAVCPETQQPLLLAVNENLPLTPDKVVSQ